MNKHIFHIRQGIFFLGYKIIHLVLIKRAIISCIIYVAYLLAGILMYKSTISGEFKDAHNGYLIYAIVIIFDIANDFSSLYLVDRRG